MTEEIRNIIYQEIEEYYKIHHSINEDTSIMNYINLLYDNKLILKKLFDNRYELLGNLLFKYREYVIKDAQLLKYIISLNGYEFIYANEELKNDKEVALNAIKQTNFAIINCISDSLKKELKKDYEFVKEYCAKFPEKYETLNKKMRDNKELLMYILKKQRNISSQRKTIFLKYATNKLREDREVIKKAVRFDLSRIYEYECRELYYVDKSLLEDEIFVKELIKIVPFVYEYITDSMKEKLFNFTINNIHDLKKLNVRCFSKNTLKDKNKVIKILDSIDDDNKFKIYEKLDVTLLYDKDIIKSTIKRNELSLNNFSKIFNTIQNLNDVNFIKELITINPLVYDYLNSDAKKNREVIYETLLFCKAGTLFDKIYDAYINA